MSMVFRIELATSWRTAMRQRYLHRYSPTTASTMDDTQTTEETSALSRWHIINLCAHAFIMGKYAEKIAREMDAAMREGDLKKIGELWRKRGALGRLHNVIKHIRGSPQRREFFGKQVCGGELAEFDGLEVSSRSCPSTSYYLDWSIKR